MFKAVVATVYFSAAVLDAAHGVSRVVVEVDHGFSA